MTKRLALLLIASLAFTGTVFATDRLLAEAELIKKLNGSPVTLGTAHSADAGAAFSTCVNTATPFDAGFGDLDFFTCTDPVFAKGGTCSSTAAATDRPILANTEYAILLTSSEMAIAFRQQDAGASASCWVGHSR